MRLFVAYFSLVRFYPGAEASGKEGISKVMIQAVPVGAPNLSESEFKNVFVTDKDKIETIYLEADKTIYYPRPQSKPKELEDKYVVLYFGSVLPLQGVDVVLDVIRMLKNETRVFFDIIGPIPDKYGKPIQDNVIYTEWLRQEELANHIANADLCLAGHFNNIIEKAYRTIPGKAFIYEAMGKRMILGDSEANNELFSQDYNHLFVKQGESDELLRVIMSIISAIPF